MIYGAENLSRIKLFAEDRDAPQGVVVGERSMRSEVES